MTWAAFTSEWTKLKRKTLLLSTFLGLAAASSLFVILLFTQAPATGDGGGLPSLQQLARPKTGLERPSRWQPWGTCSARRRTTRPRPRP